MLPFVLRQRHRWLLPLLAILAVGFGVLFGTAVLDTGLLVDEVPFAGRVLLGALTLASGVLAWGWMRMFLRDEPLMVVDEQGFEYRPAGVTTGRVAWADVLAIRDDTVMAAGRPIGGPTLCPAVAIDLRDPDAYVARFPAPLKALFAFRAGENGTPLVLDLTLFGADGPRARAAMETALARHRARA